MKRFDFVLDSTEVKVHPSMHKRRITNVSAAKFIILQRENHTSFETVSHENNINHILYATSGN